MKHNLLGYLKG